MESMIASRYARAYYELAQEKKLQKELDQDSGLLRQTMEQYPQLMKMMEAPEIPAERKRASMEHIFGGSCQKETLELVALLLRKGRIAYLTDILKEYGRLSALQRGEATAWVRSASELSEQQRMKLQKVLEKKTNRKITLQVQVEPELLGGMVVRLGDQLYDNSVRSRLEKMRVHLQSIHLEGGEKVG